MQTKRDQVQAHMFLMGRLASGLLRSNPDNDGSPGVRTHKGLAIGVVIGALLSAGACLLGLVSPGATDGWRKEGTLVLEKGTGTRYLYLGGRLRPVVNHASARLVAGGALTTVEVSAAKLAGTPRGRPLGIAGAPQSLPAASSLADAPWQVCAGLVSSAAVAPLAVTMLGVGVTDTGVVLRDSQALLVEGPDKVRHLLWKGSRLRLDGASEAQAALGLGSVPAQPVSAAFLNAVPAGPDLAPPEVAGMGTAGPAIEGRPTRLGQVFDVLVPGGGSRFHQLTKAGLVRLSATRAALALGDPRVRDRAYAGGTPSALPVTAAAARGHVAAAGTAAALGLPE
ncbi:type VII secretion protein EccB, partial [Streptomyces sp. NPDC035033]|uniref:type VII secretion protein EccB n=1 Tax=Streptomyces sp. NPDC035033 TaxID=3155368 RepID=UPI003410ADF6